MPQPFAVMISLTRIAWTETTDRKPGFASVLKKDEDGTARLGNARVPRLGRKIRIESSIRASAKKKSQRGLSLNPPQEKVIGGRVEFARVRIRYPRRKVVEKPYLDIRISKPIKRVKKGLGHVIVPGSRQQGRKETQGTPSLPQKGPKGLSAEPSIINCFIEGARRSSSLPRIVRKDTGPSHRPALDSSEIRRGVIGSLRDLLA